MRILQVHKFFHIKGGSEVYLFSLTDALKERGHNVAEFSMKSKKNKDSLWSKYFIENIDYDTTETLKKIKYGLKIIYSREAKNNISKLLIHFKPDIVHLHIFQHQLSPSILPVIKKKKIPIVYTAHDLKCICPNYKLLSHGHFCEECKGHKYYNCLKKKCVKNSYPKSLINVIEMYFHHWRRYYDLIDLIITPSIFHRKKLIEFGFPRDKIVHLPNFLDENHYSPSYSFGNYFTYFGRLSDEKGLPTLIKAMKFIEKKKLVIIGTGPLKNALYEMIDQFNIKNVRLVGFKTGDQLRKLLRHSMFSILPSEGCENGPLSLIESFAYGKPVIGSNMGGIPEHISHKKDGLIFEAKNYYNLAQQINFLINNPIEIKRMGKNARLKVKNKFSKKKHIKSIEEIYNKLLP